MTPKNHNNNEVEIYLICNSKEIHNVSQNNQFPHIGIVVVNDFNNPIGQKTTALPVLFSNDGRCAYWNFNNGKLIPLTQYDIIMES